MKDTKSPPGSWQRAKTKIGAQQTASKFAALAQAQADNSPSYRPDRQGKGRGHVELLQSCIANRARANRIQPAQYLGLIGWAAR